VGGPDLGFPEKPDPAMVRAALDAMGVPPAETLFVGDMTVDVATARAAGLAVAVVPLGSSTREELEASGPEFLSSSRGGARAVRNGGVADVSRVGARRDVVSVADGAGREMAWSERSR
jgi:phosphoglycolate phosphatase